MNLDRLHSTVIDLCRIPSPSRRERRIAVYVRARAAFLGLPVHEDDGAAALEGDTGNLFVRTVGGRGEPIFLCAHMDTVAVPELDPIPVVVEADRIHTGGRSPLGGDDKVGVALALELLAEAVARPHEARPLDVVFCVQEEIGCRGSGHVDPALISAREGFVLDGETEPYSAIREAPTKDWYRIAVTGRRAHAAVNPQEGRNAVRAAGALAAALPGGRIGGRRRGQRRLDRRRRLDERRARPRGPGRRAALPARRRPGGVAAALRADRRARDAEARHDRRGRMGARLRRLLRGRRRALCAAVRRGLQGRRRARDLLPFIWAVGTPTPSTPRGCAASW